MGSSGETRATHAPADAAAGGDRTSFNGLPYFNYDPRSACSQTSTRGDRYSARSRRPRTPVLVHARSATPSSPLDGQNQSLDVYWLNSYGGRVLCGDPPTQRGAQGLRRASLLDTVKGSDLGREDGRLVLDFNFAYNPSCASTALGVPAGAAGFGSFAAVCASEQGAPAAMTRTALVAILSASVRPRRAGHVSLRVPYTDANYELAGAEVERLDDVPRRPAPFERTPAPELAGTVPFLSGHRRRRPAPGVGRSASICASR